MLNYPDCFELANPDARVTLCHHVGGRVVEYSFKGRNALCLDQREGKWASPAGPKRHPSAPVLLSLCLKTIVMGDMSLAELKESVLALPEKERHDLFVWLDRLEASQGAPPSAPSPDGYFASDYPLPEDRLELEAAMAKIKQSPDR